MNNKPFDLQKALAGEPVISGTENMTAEYLCTVNNVKSGTCHIFKIKFMDSSSSLPSEAVYFFTDTGIGYTNQQLTVRASHVDLFMAPVKKTHYFASWKNAANGKPRRFTTNMYESEETLMKTDRMIGSKEIDYLIHTIEIEE